MDDILCAKRYPAHGRFERAQEGEQVWKEHNVPAADAVKFRVPGQIEQFRARQQYRVFIEGTIPNRL